MHINIPILANSLEDERKIIEQTRKESSWLDENKCYYNLPENEISNKDYKYADYKKFIDKVSILWKKKEAQFIEKIHRLFEERIPRVEIKITRYGTGGFYFLSKEGDGVVTINMDAPYDPIFSIKHEIIHLIAQPYIYKYKISHEKKEKFVHAVAQLIG